MKNISQSILMLYFRQYIVTIAVKDILKLEKQRLSTSSQTDTLSKPTVILFQLQVERPYINHNGQLIYLQNQYTPQPIVHNSMVSDSQDGISRDGRLER